MPGIRLTPPPAHIFHSYYKYYFFVEPDQLHPDWSRDRVMQAVLAEGIPCFSGSCSEIYLEKAFSTFMRPKRRLEKARILGETSLMLLVHPTLSEDDMHDMADAVEKVMKAAVR
jgi:dTDP-4-amino-4,6-dideoxygalactose transaminase